jgi:hypothetical protein
MPVLHLAGYLDEGCSRPWRLPSFDYNGRESRQSNCARIAHPWELLARSRGQENGSGQPGSKTHRA